MEEALCQRNANFEGEKRREFNSVRSGTFGGGRADRMIVNEITMKECI